METLVLEIRAGEGGMDSKMFVQDMARMYVGYCAQLGFSVEYL